MTTARLALTSYDQWDLSKCLTRLSSSLELASTDFLSSFVGRSSVRVGCCQLSCWS